MKDIKTLVSEHPFFKELRPDYLDVIAGCAGNVHFRKGSYLFHEGEPADQFYLLRGGRAALEISVPGREPATLQTLQEGEVIGWSWLFPPYVWQFDARAIDDIRATAFDGKCLREKCQADHDLGYELAMRSAQIMLTRLQATRIQLLDLYGTGG